MSPYPLLLARIRFLLVQDIEMVHWHTKRVTVIPVPHLDLVLQVAVVVLCLTIMPVQGVLVAEHLEVTR